MIVTTLILCLLLAVASAGILARAMKAAPEGSEDDAGFHSAPPMGQDRVVTLASSDVAHAALKLHHPAA